MHAKGLGPVPNVPSSLRAASPEPIKNPPEPESSPDQSSAEPLTEENPPEAEARALRLARIKAAIEAGDYETQDKLDAALSRLFEEIGLDDDSE